MKFFIAHPSIIHYSFLVKRGVRKNHGEFASLGESSYLCTVNHRRWN